MVNIVTFNDSPIGSKMNNDISSRLELFLRELSQFNKSQSRTSSISYYNPTFYKEKTYVNYKTKCEESEAKYRQLESGTIK